MEINNESNIVIKIIFIALFLVIMLLAVVIIIGALNQGNTQVGNVYSGSITNETFYTQTANSTYVISTLNNIKCTVSSITYYNGTVVPASNYIINNCQVTFN
jgi:hypothetical protein